MALNFLKFLLCLLAPVMHSPFDTLLACSISDFYTQLTVSTSSIPGLRHRGQNQDSILSHSYFPFFAVADGISSNRGGKFASQNLVNDLSTIIDAAQYSLLCEVTYRTFFKLHFQQLSFQLKAKFDRIKEQANFTPNKGFPGSTLTSMVLKNSKLYAAHVGDSELVIWRKAVLYRIFKGHTKEQFYIQHGFPPSCFSPSMQVIHRNTLTSCFSAGLLFPAQVDYAHFDLKSGDIVLLFTDGVTKGLSDDDLRNYASVMNAEELVDLAKARGSTDDISLIKVIIP